MDVFENLIAESRIGECPGVLDRVLGRERGLEQRKRRTLRAHRGNGPVAVGSTAVSNLLPIIDNIGAVESILFYGRRVSVRNRAVEVLK
jgi:hypothetical protein